MDKVRKRGRPKKLSSQMAADLVNTYMSRSDSVKGVCKQFDVTHKTMYIYLRRAGYEPCRYWRE